MIWYTEGSFYYFTDQFKNDIKKTKNHCNIKRDSIDFWFTINPQLPPPT